MGEGKAPVPGMAEGCGRGLDAGDGEHGRSTGRSKRGREAEEREPVGDAAPAPASAAGTDEESGPAEREYTGFARRYASRIRLVAVSLCAVLGAAAMPVGPLPATVALGVLVWSLVEYRLSHSGRGSGLLLAADTAVMAALCLSQGLTVPAEQTQHGNTWVLVTVSMVMTAHQLTYPPVPALSVAVLLAAADLAGAALDRPEGWTYALPNASWLLVQAALAQALHRLVLRRARSADAAGAAAARERRRYEVARAQQAAEREYLATLHDTACATLLMVSLRGQIIDPAVLRAQAAEDLRRLAAATENSITGETDVADALRAEAAGRPLTVRTDFSGELGTAWHPAVVALQGSLGEALRNVERHAGVDRATVTASREGDRVLVTVSDEGVGFDPDGVPEHCRGVERSIVERMAAVGGTATVDSRPGAGTRIRLEWPRV
ncbi:sensor histidine kinase [Streptomyces sp. NPDC088254]|uniref:sensor histidine kinase n=1 Tax=Streptomyces sp. NPDC088254 TaxID=3365847 RepID=UPI00381FF2BF